MIFTFETKQNCEAIENRIEEDAKAFGLILKKHFPFSKNLPEAGFEINEHVSIFELCKAPIAAKLLNTHPELSVLLPCRISIYNKEGICYASTPDLHVQLAMMACEEALKLEILDLFDKITRMIKGW